MKKKAEQAKRGAAGKAASTKGRARRFVNRKKLAARNACRKKGAEE